MVREVLWKRKGIGRSGGVRVIYFVHLKAILPSLKSRVLIPPYLAYRFVRFRVGSKVESSRAAPHELFLPSPAQIPKHYSRPQESSHCKVASNSLVEATPNARASPIPFVYCLSRGPVRRPRPASNVRRQESRIWDDSKGSCPAQCPILKTEPETQETKHVQSRDGWNERH